MRSLQRRKMPRIEKSGAGSDAEGIRARAYALTLLTTPGNCSSGSASRASSVERRIVVGMIAGVVNGDKKSQVCSEFMRKSARSVGQPTKTWLYVICHLPSADRFSQNPMPPQRFSVGVNRSRCHVPIKRLL